MPTKSGESAPSNLTPSNLKSEALTAGADIDAITSASHPDPFAVLGVHPTGSGFIARCFIPGAETVIAFARGRNVGELTRCNKSGFFDGRVTLRKHEPLVYVA